MDDPADHHSETFVPQRFRHLRRQQADLAIDAPQKTGFLALGEPKIAPPPVRKEMGEEADEIAALGAASHFLRQRHGDRTDEPAQFRRLSRRLHLGEQGGAALIDLRNAAPEECAKDIVHRSEMIADRRLVALTGRERDLAAGNRLDTELGEKPLRRVHQHVF